MLKYAVVEIAGKQYLAEPGKEIRVNNLGDVKNVDCQVLLKSDGDKIEVGTPYLKETLKFDVVGSDKTKIRVAKYHAKANYRRVIGAKNLYTKVKLAEGVKKA